MTKEEIIKKVDQLAPWHYCHQLPFGITTGTCIEEEYPHDKLKRLLKAGVFSRSIYPRVLDLGANSGIISIYFANEKGSLIDAIEGGKKFYDQLEFIVDVKGYKDKIAPIKADITKYEFLESEYDLILYLGTMHHISEVFHKAVLEKCLRALLPGGEIIVQTKDTLLVAQLLSESGFLEVRKLETNWSDRVAWFAFKDSMKI